MKLYYMQNRLENKKKKKQKQQNNKTKHCFKYSKNGFKYFSIKKLPFLGFSNFGALIMGIYKSSKHRFHLLVSITGLASKTSLAMTNSISSQLGFSKHTSIGLENIE